jgi:hypothetical protein
MPGFIGASGTPSITARNRTGPPLTVSVAVSLTSRTVQRVMPRPGTLCHPVPEIDPPLVVHFADWRSAAPVVVRREDRDGRGHYQERDPEEQKQSASRAKQLHHEPPSVGVGRRLYLNTEEPAVLGRVSAGC